MKLVAATGNKHKLREMREIFPDFEILSAAEAGFFEDVEETETTFLGNALLKARAVMRATGLISLADDSGLAVDALSGEPGVYSARYSAMFAPQEWLRAHMPLCDGKDALNRAFLLARLKGKTDRSAHFCCAIVLCFPDGRELTAEGRTFGHILTEERGASGFGYDPLFFSDDLQKSFGEADEAEKNAVSHRGRALAALREQL